VAAEAGDDIVLTHHGRATVRLVAVKAAPDAAAHRSILDAILRAGMDHGHTGPTAARCQDFLYGDDGLPG
jgi:antitoxin (DNA-binding transcriptional repressor) of toxin-antitoxin stability system